MTGRIALVAGLFVAPAVLLWLGHRMRDRSPRQRAAFWGGAIGHSTAMLITLVAALFPPVWWHEGGPVRDFAIHWSMLIGFLVGSAVALLRADDAPATEPSDRRSGTDRRGQATSTRAAAAADNA